MALSSSSSYIYVNYVINRQSGGLVTLSKRNWREISFSYSTQLSLLSSASSSFYCCHRHQLLMRLIELTMLCTTIPFHSTHHQHNYTGKGMGSSVGIDGIKWKICCCYWKWYASDGWWDWRLCLLSIHSGLSSRDTQPLAYDDLLLFCWLCWLYEYGKGNGNGERNE